MRKFLFLLSVSALLPSISQAQESAAPLVESDGADEDARTLTITGDGFAASTELTGESVSILTRSEIEELQGADIVRVLTRTPGVAASRNGGVGSFTGIRLRGAEAEQLLVLVDGVRVADPAAPGAGFDFGNLLPGTVGRIELLRGTQSALYGSRAIAGVLSIDTLRPTEDGLRQNFAIEAGQYQTFAASYGAALRRDGTDLAFTASRVTSQGFSARDENDGNFETDSYNASRLSFYAARELQNGGKVGINGFWDKSRAEFDEFPPQILRPARLRRGHDRIHRSKPCPDPLSDRPEKLVERRRNALHRVPHQGVMAGRDRPGHDRRTRDPWRRYREREGRWHGRQPHQRGLCRS